MRTTKQKKHDYFRAKENASKYHWDRMTKEERDWLVAFDASEYEVERGHINDALNLLTEQNIVPSEEYINGMESRREDARKSNPVTADIETKAKRKYDNYQGIRAPKDNMYDSADYVRVMPGKILKDDLGFTAVYSTTEALESVEGNADHVEGHLADKVYKPFKVEAGLNPDETAVMLNPEDGMIEAIDHAAKKARSLEKLIEDAKLSKEAKDALRAKTQGFVYAGSTYSKHANLILDMNYILKGQDGLLWVQDQHGRLQSLALYLKRRTSESIITHAETSYPELLEIWVFKRGPRSDIEGKAVKYETV